MKHSFYTLNNEKLLAIFKEKGIEFKEEENGKYYPRSNDAKDILNVLKEYLNNLNIDIILNNPVNDIIKTKDKNDYNPENNNEFKNNLDYNDDKANKSSFEIRTSKTKIISEKVILATGGISYPQVGSTGDGYKIANSFNHKIANIKPGLVSLKVENKLFEQMSGLSFKNLEISLKSKQEPITLKGDMIITHFGLSGPAILDISNYINDISEEEINEKNNFENNFENCFENGFENIAILIDFIPNLSKEELNTKIIEDSQSNGKTMIKNYLKYYLKNRFINFFLNASFVSGNKTLSNMTKKDKNKIIANLKGFEIKIDGFAYKELAMITCGGVKTEEINPKTMESKLVDGVYFAGELLESYGPTGGYSLQIAFSTGYLAGKSAAIS